MIDFGFIEEQKYEDRHELIHELIRGHGLIHCMCIAQGRTEQRDQEGPCPLIPKSNSVSPIYCQVG